MAKKKKTVSEYMAEFSNSIVAAFFASDNWQKLTSEEQRNVDVSSLTVGEMMVWMSDSPIASKWREDRVARA